MVSSLNMLPYSQLDVGIGYPSVRPQTPPSSPFHHYIALDVTGSIPLLQPFQLFQTGLLYVQLFAIVSGFNKFEILATLSCWGN
jgi:hypothetical protein